MAGFEIVAENEDIILLYGKNDDFGLMQMHYAFNAPGCFLRHTEKYDGFLMTFVDDKIAANLKEEGFEIFGVWRDYFNEDIAAYGEEQGLTPLTEDGYARASQITLACKNQSRGFMGQTAEWIAGWMKNANQKPGENEIRDATILTHSENGEMAGIICLGIYGHESERGAILWIRELAVHPDYQRRGIATKLLRQGLGYGAMHGAKRSFLAADELNAGALKIYERLGFVRDGDEHETALYKPEK